MALHRSTALLHAGDYPTLSKAHTACGATAVRVCLHNSPRTMPLGNPNVWKKTGRSFADLAKEEAGPGPSSGSQAVQQQQQQLSRAGAPSTQRPRGAGSFQAQSGWSLGDASRGMPNATETKTQYRPPPEGLTRVAPFSYGTSFPHPNYPHDRKTLNQINFSADGLKGAQRTEPVKPRASQHLLPQDVPPQYSTAYKTLFHDHAPESKSGPRAGNPAANPPGYNIITGGAPLGNNKFEYYSSDRDYKRHR